MMKVNILGTDYTIEIKTKAEDKFLEEMDGYCDKTSKKIVVAAEDEGNQLEIYSEYQKKITRHEIIHAFLFESGLHENFEHKQWGHDETFVDWVAAQFPKMLKVFQEAECI